MDGIFYLISTVVVSIIGYVAGHQTKRDQLNERLEGIVSYIIADVQEHSTVDWNDIDPYLEDGLRLKWSLVIQKGRQGYLDYVDKQLGRQSHDSKTNKGGNHE